MKEKISVYIKKLKSLLDKIKPWIKTKRAWLQIALSILAVICLIMAGVSSCSRHYIVDNIKVTETPSVTAEDDIDKSTETPEPTATPEATDLAVTATPAATEKTSISNNNSSAEDPVVPDNDIPGRAEQVSPTGIPLYTPVPEENVDTIGEAYRAVVTSCWGSADYSSYYLYDMDADGTEELIIHYGNDDMAAYIDVYTYTDEGLTFVGDATGCFARIRGSSDKGILVYYNREINGLKYESVEQFVKEGTSMHSSTKVVQAQVDEYTVWETDVEILRYRIDDLSPFN